MTKHELALRLYALAVATERAAGTALEAALGAIFHDLARTIQRTP